MILFFQFSQKLYKISDVPFCVVFYLLSDHISSKSNENILRGEKGGKELNKQKDTPWGSKCSLKEQTVCAKRGKAKPLKGAFLPPLSQK